MIFLNLFVVERIFLNVKGEFIDLIIQQLDFIKFEKIFVFEVFEIDNLMKLLSDLFENEDIVMYLEGGWIVWGVVLGSWFVFFGFMFFMNSLGVF